MSETITVQGAPWTTTEKLVALLGRGRQICPTCKTELIRNSLTATAARVGLLALAIKAEADER